MRNHYKGLSKIIFASVMMWQVIIHLTFVISAMLLAYTDNIMNKTIASH